MMIFCNWGVNKYKNHLISLYWAFSKYIIIFYFSIRHVILFCYISHFLFNLYDFIYFSLNLIISLNINLVEFYHFRVYRKTPCLNSWPYPREDAHLKNTNLVGCNNNVRNSIPYQAIYENQKKIFDKISPSIWVTYLTRNVYYDKIDIINFLGWKNKMHGNCNTINRLCIISQTIYTKNFSNKMSGQKIIFKLHAHVNYTSHKDSKRSTFLVSQFSRCVGGYHH